MLVGCCIDPAHGGVLLLKGLQSALRDDTGGRQLQHRRRQALPQLCFTRCFGLAYCVIGRLAARLVLQQRRKQMRALGGSIHGLRALGARFARGAHAGHTARHSRRRACAAAAGRGGLYLATNARQAARGGHASAIYDIRQPHQISDRRHLHSLTRHTLTPPPPHRTRPVRQRRARRACPTRLRGSLAPLERARRARRPFSSKVPHRPEQRPAPP